MQRLSNALKIAVDVPFAGRPSGTLHVSPQLRGFGMLVVLSLSLAFVVSVFVFPSVLLVWARRMDLHSTRDRKEVATGAAND